MTRPAQPARAATADARELDIAELLDKIELGLCIGTEADLAVAKYEGTPDRTDTDILAAHAALSKLRALLHQQAPTTDAAGGR